MEEKKPLFNYTKIIIAGIGGVGTDLVFDITKMLMGGYIGIEKVPLWLIDGDIVEPENRQRQHFLPEAIGKNKAMAMYEYLKDKMELDINVTVLQDFLKPANIDMVIDEFDNPVVFLGVDNDPTKWLVQDKLEKLKNYLLIIMANDVFDGDVMVALKIDGKTIIPPIWTHQERFLTPEKLGSFPGETYVKKESCVTTNNIQVVGANRFAEVLGLAKFYQFLLGKQSELTKITYFNIETCKTK